jgi:hypothetical protein
MHVWPIDDSTHAVRGWGKNDTHKFLADRRLPDPSNEWEDVEDKDVVLDDDQEANLTFYCQRCLIRVDRLGYVLTNPKKILREERERWWENHRKKVAEQMREAANQDTETADKAIDDLFS